LNTPKTPEKQPEKTSTTPETQKGIFSNLNRIAYRLFHRSIEKNPDRYYAIETSLKQAKKAIPVEVFLPRTIFISTITAITTGTLGIIAGVSSPDAGAHLGRGSELNSVCPEPPATYIRRKQVHLLSRHAP